MVGKRLRHNDLNSANPKSGRVLPDPPLNASVLLSTTDNEQPSLPQQNKPPQKDNSTEPDKTGVVEEKEIATTTSRSLLRIRAHKPLRAFQDELTIDELKVNFIYRFFFGSEQVRSFLIKDIEAVRVETSPFFSAIKISVGPYKDLSTGPITVPGGTPQTQLGPMMIGFLRRNDAEQARRLIQGLIIMDQEKIDTSKTEVSAVVAKAEELGRAR